MILFVNLLKCLQKLIVRSSARPVTFIVWTLRPIGSFYPLRDVRFTMHERLSQLSAGASNIDHWTGMAERATVLLCEYPNVGIRVSSTASAGTLCISWPSGKQYNDCFIRSWPDALSNKRILCLFRNYALINQIFLILWKARDKQETIKIIRKS